MKLFEGNFYCQSCFRVEQPTIKPKAVKRAKGAAMVKAVRVRPRGESVAAGEIAGEVTAEDVRRRALAIMEGKKEGGEGSELREEAGEGIKKTEDALHGALVALKDFIRGKKSK
jgi:hypothetical protein